MSDAQDFTVAIGTVLLDAVEGTNSELCGAIDTLTHAGTHVDRIAA